MKKAFTLVEILIVVALLGILAAVVLPTLQGHITEAKEAAAKDNLRILRNIIELYAAQHNGYPPGYVNEILKPVPVTITKQLCYATNSDGVDAPLGTVGYPLGPYLSAIPKNPLNNKNTMQVLGAAVPFPDPANGNSGWIYKPSTRIVKPNYPGTDSKGIKYYDY